MIETTPAGCRELAQLDAIGTATFAEVVAGWTNDDLLTLARLLPGTAASG